MTTQEYEQKGRQKLKADFDASDCEMIYEFTDERYDSIDCFATACTGVRYAIEIKNRDISISKYDKILLEKVKYDALIDAYKKGYRPIYRCYFKDGCLTWDLSLINIDNRVEQMPCAISTQEYDRKVEKTVIMLKKEEAIDKKRNNRNNS